MNGIVRVASDGSIAWHGDSGVALGPVVFEVNGIAFAIDAARGDEVVDLAAPDAAALRSVSQWFANPDAIEAIAAAPDGAQVPGPIAGDVLTRVATVEAVDRCYVGDLNESILAVDGGYAGRLVGDERRAALGYSFAPATLELLVDQIENADYFGPLNQRVIEVVREAPSFILDDAEKRDLLVDVRKRVDDAEHPWEVFLAETAQPEVAAILGGGAETRSVVADLRMLPPRLLTFTGPNEPEITIEHADGYLTITADLRDDVIRDSAEATGVFAVVADRQTGRLLAHAPARVDGDKLKAHLKVTGLDVDSLRCGLVGPDAELDSLRMDPVGAKLVEIDRFCRYAWSEHRRAGAILAMVGAMLTDEELNDAQAEALQARSDAKRAARTASKRCDSLLDGDFAQGSESELRKFVGAVDRLAEQISVAPTTDGPAGPTLAELHAVVFG